MRVRYGEIRFELPDAWTLGDNGYTNGKVDLEIQVSDEYTSPEKMLERSFVYLESLGATMPKVMTGKHNDMPFVHFITNDGKVYSMYYVFLRKYEHFFKFSFKKAETDIMNEICDITQSVQ
jgi:hypothetical protein